MTPETPSSTQLLNCARWNHARATNDAIPKRCRKRYAEQAEALTKQAKAAAVRESLGQDGRLRSDYVVAGTIAGKRIEIR